MDKKEIIKYLMQGLNNYLDGDKYSYIYCEAYCKAINDVLKNIIGREKYKLKDFLNLFNCFPFALYLFFDKLSKYDYKAKYYVFCDKNESIEKNEGIEKYFDYDVVDYCISGGCIRIAIGKENKIEDKNNKTENKTTLKEFLYMFNFVENTKTKIILLDEQGRLILVYYQKDLNKYSIIGDKAVQQVINYPVKSFGFENSMLTILIEKR